MSNKNFNVGQSVVCVVGSNKGKVFTIEKVLNKSYSCRPQGEEDGKYYEFNDRNLSSIDDWNNQDEIVENEIGEEAMTFTDMRNLVRENGGKYMAGNMWDVILFEGDNHKEISAKVYEEIRSAGVNVYGLAHSIDETSRFFYQ